MRAAVDASLETEPFRQRDAEAAGTRGRLQATMPYLSGTDTEFVWMHAADYFMCRAAHELPLLPGLTEEDAAATVQQVEWRFDQWYRSHFVRAHAAGPLLTRLLDRMCRAALGRPSELVLLYSGHDITVLPLLHALTGQPGHLWPRYAANVRVELLQSRRLPSQLFVRAFYNDEPLRIRGCDANVCSLYHFQRLVNQERLAHGAASGWHRTCPS